MPVPEEQMTALEQVVYQQVFSGDAELERVQQTTLHFLGTYAVSGFESAYRIAFELCGSK